MIIYAIDPGTEMSAVVQYDTSTRKILEAEQVENEELLCQIYTHPENKTSSNIVLGIEMVASYGMAVGKTVFETVYWIGRFVEAANNAGWKSYRVFRQDIKLFLCNSVRAKDANIRQAIIDRFPPVGEGKTPQIGNKMFGLNMDDAEIWAAILPIMSYIIGQGSADAGR